MSTESSLPPLPEQTLLLLRRARAGEAGAVDELLERFAPRVRGLAALRMGEALVDLADWEDVVQETLITAVDRLDDFEHRGEGSFVCWLAAIVQSRIADARRAARAEKRGGSVRRCGDLSGSVEARLPPARGPSPSHAMRAREMDGALERALLTLDPEARQLVYSRLVLEMSFAEIALELEFGDADCARARFHKAVRRLRERLGAG